MDSYENNFKLMRRQMCPLLISSSLGVLKIICRKLLVVSIYPVSLNSPFEWLIIILILSDPNYSK